MRLQLSQALPYTILGTLMYLVWDSQAEPLVSFNYYEQLDTSDPINWQRLNVLPISELVELGLDRSTATAICNERQLYGTYRSLVEVKRRTGLAINLYKHLI